MPVPLPLPRLLVLTTTFPRWRDDAEPPFVFELARRLRDDFEVTVLAPRAVGAAVREQMGGVDVIRFPYFLPGLEQLAYGGGILGNIRARPWRVVLVPFLILGLLRALRQTLRRGAAFDVVHAHWLFPQAWAATWFLREPRPSLVATSHGADLFALRGWLWNAVRQRVIRRAAAVTVVSESMAEEIRRTCQVSRPLRVIPMGVDLTAAFVPDLNEARAADQLLFVGRLVPKKGCDLLLRSLGVLAERGRRLRLTIAGDGPERPALESICKALGLSDHVTFLGKVSNAALPALYRQAAVLVAPFVVAPDGDREGLGLVVVEAMGCGCPVVTTAIAKINPIVRNGDTAFVSRDLSPAALADSIVDALADPQGTAVRASRARQEAMRFFDWSSIAERYRDILATCSSSKFAKR